MRTLILPDIHNHIESADRWIESYPADQIVFLGDYFDSFYDTESMAETTAHWLKASLQEPDRIHLWGNHDLAYGFPNNRHLRCSGFTDEKCLVIRDILNADDWAKLKLFHCIAPDLLCTHAGIDSSIFAHPITGITIPRLDELCSKAVNDAQAGIRNPVLDLQGLTWLRWWEMEILSDYHQIVGHTPDPDIQIMRDEDRFNICLDTFGNYVGLVDDGQFHFIDTRSGEITQIGPEN